MTWGTASWRCVCRAQAICRFPSLPPGETRLILAAASPALPHYKHAGFTASQFARQELQAKGEMEQKLEKGKGQEKAKD
jgi:hypothetical protein